MGAGVTGDVRGGPAVDVEQFPGAEGLDQGVVRRQLGRGPEPRPAGRRWARVDPRGEARERARPRPGARRGSQVRQVELPSSATAERL